MKEMVLWRSAMDYKGELVAVSLGETAEEQQLLTTEGDWVEVYGKAGDYVLMSWSDGNGDVLAVVNCAAAQE